MATRPMPRGTGKTLSLRHLWLASIGSAVVARRGARDAAVRLRAGLVSAGARTSRLAADTMLVARGGALTLREQAISGVGRLAREFDRAGRPSQARGRRAKPARRASASRRRVVHARA